MGMPNGSVFVDGNTISACNPVHRFYAGSGEYALGIPAFEKVTVHLENGRNLILERRGSVGGFRWNGRRLRRPFLSHRRLMRGGTLTFE